MARARADHRKHLEFCENGAKAVAEEATRDRVDRAFFAAHSVSELAGWTEHRLGKAGRLTEPMWLAPGASHYAPDPLGRRVRRDRRQLAAAGQPGRGRLLHLGPDEQRGRLLLPAVRPGLRHQQPPGLLQHVPRVERDRPHRDDRGRQGHRHPGGHRRRRADRHPRSEPGDQPPADAARPSRRRRGTAPASSPSTRCARPGCCASTTPSGCRGVLGPGTELADHYLQIRVNGDLALFQAFGRMLLDAEAPGRPVIDRDFVDAHCEGFDELGRPPARGSTVGRCDRATGLTRRRDRRGVRARVRATSASSSAGRWASPSTRTPSRRSARSSTCLLARGAIGRPGAGVCPVRGHSNVQGDRTMGIWERPDRRVPRRAGRRVLASSRPAVTGSTPSTPSAPWRDGRVDVFMAVGGNFAVRHPRHRGDRGRPSAGCRLTVHVSTKLNRSHVVTGRQALILPCLGRTERDRTGGQAPARSRSRTRWARPPVAGPARARPAASSKSEVAIVCGLAERVLGDGSPSTGQTWPPTTTGSGTTSSARRPGFRRLQRERCAVPAASSSPTRCATAASSRPTRVGPSSRVNRLEILDVPDGHLLMQTVRSHDQYNTTIYGLDDRYRGISGGRRVVLVHDDDDLARLGLASRRRWSTSSRPTAGPSAGSAASGSSPTPSPVGAAPRTSPRPTPSCRSTRPPRERTPRPRSRWSCGWSDVRSPGQTVTASPPAPS